MPSPQKICESDSALPAGRTGGQFELVAGWQPLDVRSNPNDRFLPNPLGVWTTASVGGGLDTLFLNPPAFAAAWH